MKKEESWLADSGLYGTWTFTTQTMTDAGYYKGLAYLLMHVMPNPMQVNSCQLGDNNDPTQKQHQGCVEASNHACLRRRRNRKHTSTLKAATTGNEEEEECVDTETSQLDWSDVTVFFQFGIRLRTGIIRKAYHNVNTGDDWLGPYNMILAPVVNTKKKKNDTEEVFVSRYVTTPWTESQLQYPSSTATIFEANDAMIVDTLIGLTAINTTIQEAQKHWNGRHNNHGRRSDSDSIGSKMSSSMSGSSGGTKSTSSTTNSARVSTENTSIIQEQQQQRNLRQRQHQDHDHLVNNVIDDDDDPYSKQFHNCAFGDLHPQLPRLEVVKRTLTDTLQTNISYSMRIDYSILSVPEKGGINNDLYKLWPSMKKHLGSTFPVLGPYCYGNDPNRAYAIRLSYDSEMTGYFNSSSTTISTSTTTPSLWKGQKGCVSWLPCWKGDVPPPSPSSPTNHQIPSHSGGDAGDYVINPLSVAALLLYLFGVLVVGSFIVNVVLSNRLKQLQQLVQSQSSPIQSPTPTSIPSSRDEDDEDDSVEEEEQSQQQRERRYDYLEEVVGNGTGTGTGTGTRTGHCNHDGRSSNTTTNNTHGNNDNNNNRSMLNDSLEEPLLSTTSNNDNDTD